jgi:hypothetical protein
MKNCKMTTDKELIEEGWKRKTINKVRCLVKSEYGLICLAGRGRDHFWAEEMLTVVEKLGRPDKIHTLASGVVTTLEYFSLCE